MVRQRSLVVQGVWRDRILGGVDTSGKEAMVNSGITVVTCARWCEEERETERERERERERKERREREKKGEREREREEREREERKERKRGEERTTNRYNRN